MSNADSPLRTGQKLEVSFEKNIHLRDYESEKYSGSLTATFNRAMSPEEGTVEINKLQAELEYALYYTLYTRKLITTHDFDMRVGVIIEQLTALGVPDAEGYLKGGVKNG